MFKKLFTKLNEDGTRQSDQYNIRLSSNIDTTIKTIDNLVGESDDVRFKDFYIAGKIRATVIYFSGMVDEKGLEYSVLRPLIISKDQVLAEKRGLALAKHITQKVMTVSETHLYDNFDEAFLPFMSGDVLMAVEGVEHLLVLSLSEFNERSVEEPKSEVVIRGPRDGFTENIKTNTVLIRRRIKDPNFVVQIGSLGRRAKKTFAIGFIKGVANPDLVEEVRYRLACIDSDDVSETGTLEQLIQDNIFTPFPQLLHSERPDRAADAIMEGQVVILLDGTPFCLHAPVTLHQLLKSPEDYYERWGISSLIRILRYIAAFISMFVSAIYIALTTYHQGMIPTTLALSIAGTREGVPFPALIEVLLMEITIELLREAGIRLPRLIGQTIGIVGGLVIGEAAIQAGIVSPILAVVVALTAVSSFVIPNYSVSIAFRMLRFIMMFAAAAFGLYGIIIVYIMINIHLVGLRSFGSYYLSPFAPFSPTDWVDVIIRAPLPTLRIRKAEPKTLDSKKQKTKKQKM
ncbi:spore germination protein [Caldalkalibacillus salinus]|uniref:spore germination protein n=1 Tax=Caldalkalibacillus salinus TaxID=2803787 RepID=UPI001924DD91|nr:spore germination protein [Caldalkalibacillus salinus]